MKGFDIGGFNFRGRFLKGVFVAAVLENGPTRSSLSLPTVKQYVLQEFINGVVGYSGGTVPFTSLGFEGLEQRVKGYYSENQPKIVEKMGHLSVSLIGALIEPRLITPDRERPYYTTEFYDHFNGGNSGLGGVCPRGLVDHNFEVTHNLVVSVMGSKGKFFSKGEEAHIQGIGEAMRPYIKRDLSRPHY